MIRVDAHALTLQIEGILTKLGVTQLVLVEVGPTPYSGIYNVRKALSSSDLKRKYNDGVFVSARMGSRGRWEGERGGGRERGEGEVPGVFHQEYEVWSHIWTVGHHWL